jgi:hypothetical protein
MLALGGGSYCSSRVDETEVSAEDMLNNEPIWRRMGIIMHEKNVSDT